MRKAFPLCVGAAFASVFTAHVSVASVADFYKGNTIAIAVGHQPGTGFDLYARTLARFMPAHIPGQPAAVIQNMPGASGLNAFNWLANIAPKDGSAMLTATHTAPFEPLLGNKSARFNAAQLSWIGNMDAGVGVCGVTARAGIEKFEDAFNKELLIGSPGRTGPMSQTPRALAQILGVKFKVIEGYKGSASVKLALERGEVNGACGISYSTVRTQYKDLYASGQFRLILQLGLERQADLKNIPNVYEFAKTDDDRRVFDMIFGSQGLGRAFVAPSGVPADRIEALRGAFVKTMSDPKFLEEAEKVGLDLRPQSGAEVQAIVERIYSSPPSAIDRAREILSK
jgi:tripartite-type tricarboxylate transporter receptor subunit TctC